MGVLDKAIDAAFILLVAFYTFIMFVFVSEFQYHLNEKLGGICKLEVRTYLPYFHQKLKESINIFNLRKHSYNLILELVKAWLYIRRPDINLI